MYFTFVAALLVFGRITLVAQARPAATTYCTHVAYQSFSGSPYRGFWSPSGIGARRLPCPEAHDSSPDIRV